MQARNTDCMPAADLAVFQMIMSSAQVLPRTPHTDRNNVGCVSTAELEDARVQMER